MNYIFDFKNAGEVWTFLGAVGSLLVVVVALLPLLKEFIHSLGVRSLLRNRLIFDPEIIHESYLGKVLSNPELFVEPFDSMFVIPSSDFEYFENIEKLYGDVAYLTSVEKKWMAAILSIFRRATYRKFDGDFLMRTSDIRDIEHTTKSIAEYIYGKINKKGKKVRELSYSNIASAGLISGKSYIPFHKVANYLKE